MMRIDSLLQRGWTLRALVLAAIFGSVACNDYDGTERWPGAYPSEEEIDRPKGGTMDAGPRDAGSEAGTADGAAPDGGIDAGAMLDGSARDAAPDAQPSGDAAPDAQPSGDAAPDAAS